MTSYGIENIRFLFPWDDEPAPPPDPDPDPPPTLESLITTQLPGGTDNDATYTLGTVFNVAVAGQVVGVRAYLDVIPPSTSPIAQLYRWVSNSTGTLLASKPFGALIPGWNEVIFDTPVDVVPTDTYVTAYGPTNRYDFTSGFFATAGLTNGNLSSPMHTVGKENGKFIVSPTPAYPQNAFNGGFYFVDTLFVAAP